MTKALRLRRAELHQSGAPAAVLRVVQGEGNHRWVPRQDGVHAAAEIADAFSVDDPHLVDAFFEACIQVIRDEFADVPGAERVEVQHTVDRQFVRLIHATKLRRRPKNESLSLRSLAPRRELRESELELSHPVSCATTAPRLDTRQPGSRFVDCPH